MVDLLFNGTSGEQPVDGDLFGLADPPWPLPGLGVGARVPVRVIDDHPVGPRKVHSQTPDAGRQQEHEDSGILFEWTEKDTTLYPPHNQVSSKACGLKTKLHTSFLSMLTAL